MAFPTGWGRRCALVIQSSQVDSNLSNFPVLLTEDTLPSEMFDADGSYPGLEGGGDIRFSSDSAGSVQLACEIVSFHIDNDPGNGYAEIWVNVASVSSGADTTIYVWYNKSGETQPAVDAAYGAESVWDSNFVLVQHMNEDPSGSAPQMIDSTSWDNDGTSAGTMTTGDLVAAQVGNGIAFDGSNDYINLQQPAELDFDPDDDDFTVEAWVNTSVGGYIISKGETTTGYRQWGLFVSQTTGDIGSWLGGVTHDYTEGPNHNTGTPHYIALKNYDSGGTQYFRHYSAGVEEAAETASGSYATSDKDVLIAARRGADNSDYGYLMNGIIDELRVSNIARSVDWITACYRNQGSPATFVIEGTPATPGAISGGIMLMMDHFNGGMLNG
jgi:hypothetical protein